MLTATPILDQSKIQIENHPKFYMLKGPKGRELEKQVLNSYPLQESLRSPLLICGPTKIPWTPKFVIQILAQLFLILQNQFSLDPSSALKSRSLLFQTGIQTHTRVCKKSSSQIYNQYPDHHCMKLHQSCQISASTLVKLCDVTK